MTARPIRSTRPARLAWPDVAEAPQLGALAAADAVLDLTITALLAAHPEIERGDHENLDRAAASLWLAAVVVDAAANLRVYLGRYEVALRKEKHLTDADLDG
ncbi:MAG TPA: hypothetical protein VMI54_21915 [Polyangiaceae bacterium]|nr:hypothetical protein [Polyangiaceae bacterium]